MIKIICDGSGNGKYALVVYDSSGKKIHYQVSLGGETNNEAEYLAVISSLDYASKQLEPTLIITDSQLVVNQILGKYQVNAENLKPLCRKARSLLDRSPHITIQWKPRINVTEADQLMRSDVL